MPTVATPPDPFAQIFAPLYTMLSLFIWLPIGLLGLVLSLRILVKRGGKAGDIAQVILEVVFPKFAPKTSGTPIRRRLEAQFSAVEEGAAGERSKEPFKVHARASLLTPAEREFFERLILAAADLDLLVFPKVGLNDIFDDDRGAPRGQYSSYCQMHVDYALVTRGTQRPVAGIELDDSSHDRPDRQANDSKKDAVFQAAGLPRLRFYALAPCTTEEIMTRLRDRLGAALGQPARQRRSK